MTSFQLSMELVSLDYSAQPVVHRPGFFIFIFFSDSLFKSCFFFYLNTSNTSSLSRGQMCSHTNIDL